MLRACSYVPLRCLLCRCYSTSPEITSYKVSFARKMALAGIDRRHKIALGVSGGPDSMALCVLTSWWKLESPIKKDESGYIDGLLGIVVDHGFRAESSDEAKLVQDRVNKLGMKCEIACCDWPDGRPKLGHLLESAREMRYQKFQDVCAEHQIQILMVAHHADDQAELLILRLSRNSGVLGLAGMALVSQLFPKDSLSNPAFNNNNNNRSSILLVRPMLDFSKHDMYKICEGGDVLWVEDPTNKSSLFARNRIRASLTNLSSCFGTEIQNLILACRLTRNYVDKVCQELINRTLKIKEFGYGIIDLDKLKPLDIDDISLAQYLANILQFISQKHKPVRGRASRLLIDYIRNYPCKNSLTVSGCHISPAPGFKGKKIIISCSVDSINLKNGSKVYDFIFDDPIEESKLSTEINEIIKKDNSCSELNVPFINAKCPEDILTEAKSLDLISNSTLIELNSLQLEEQERFINSNGEMSPEKKHLTDDSGLFITPGQTCYFMNRFIITYQIDDNYESGDHCCQFCQDSSEERGVTIRHMADSDWLFLAEVSRSSEDVKFDEYMFFSAKKALKTLKLIPASARRALPVIINNQGLLMSVPSIGFSCCPLLKIEARFRPRVPLGGGFTSYK